MLNPRKHSRFTHAKATGTARVGAKFTAYDGYIYGKILELDEGRRIVQEWQTTEWPDGAPPSIAEFTFIEAPGGTRLTLVQSEVPEVQAESYRQGWIDYYWEPLKDYLNEG
jgi:activator of HSP90 ATPase